MMLTVHSLSRRCQLLPALLAGAALGLLPGSAPGLGILVPRDAAHSPIRLGRTEVKAEIQKNIARTRVVQEFLNPNPSQLEADFFFPVPKGADVTDFVLYMNGKPVQGEVLEKEKAREIYEGIVRRMQDPGLLEWADYNLFKVRVFPVPPNGTQKIELEFAQPLEADQGTFKYTFPLRTPRSIRDAERARPGQPDMKFDVEIRSDEPVRNVYSPSHPVDVKIDDPKAVRVTLAGQSPADGSGDFVLFYEPTGQDVALSLVATRNDPGADGFFSLMLSPPIKAENAEIAPQDVTFVIDTSGSMMEGNKIEQARRALIYCIRQLRPQDRFALVRFSTETEKFRDGLVAATKENADAAEAWVLELKARGGTNISDALDTGLGLRSRAADDRPTSETASRIYTVVFMTDGLPTVGQTDPERIMEIAKRAMAGIPSEATELKRNVEPSKSVRVFTFGVGHDVNTKLLDRLAEETRASAEYIRPGEDMEVPISRFFDKISRPAMTGLRLEMPGADVYDLYPKELPDLFYGSQLTVFGRYKKPGPTAIRLAGTVAGKPAEFVYEKTLPEKETENRFVEKLWGTRKIAYLLASIRQSGETAEVKDEVIALAKKYGVVTPYTSYLVTEDTPMQSPGAPPPAVFRDGIVRSERAPARLGFPMRTRDKAAEAPAAPQASPIPGSGSPMLGRASTDAGFDRAAIRKAAGVPAGAAAPSASMRSESGEAAVAASQRLRAMKDTTRVSGDQESQTRMAAGRTFQLVSGVWVDSSIAPADVSRLKIKYLSAAYFDALQIAPDLRDAFALGEKVRINLAQGVLEIAGDGKESLEPADREFLASGRDN